MDHPFHLRYRAAADVWNDALPLGNGRLGAMVFCHACQDRIQLNDDSLWSGAFHDRNNPSLREKLPEIRRLVLSGDIPAAERLIMRHMVGAPYGMRHYSPLGELDIALNQRLPFTFGWRPGSDLATDYGCDLDLMSGILTVRHAGDGVRYSREMFVSHPAQAMCIRFRGDAPGAINLDIMLNRCIVPTETTTDERRPGRRVSAGGWPAPILDSNRCVDGRTIVMQGHEAEVGFAAAARVASDGTLESAVSGLSARGCGEVVIFVASSTTNRSADPAADALGRLDAAEHAGYAALREEHVRDFSALMGRCSLDLGPAPDLPTDARVAAVSAGGSDPALAALYFQFGRYLVVSGGREGSAPLNLQGIWNADFIPMWDSKYTININLQMNYWPVETCNLSELHLPVMDLLEKMRERGRETARLMYGMRGMVCHHNTDFYGDCAPQDLYLASTPWTAGGAWLGLHAWQHFLFTRDEAFLGRMYPVLRDLALFFVDFLVEAGGRLVTCPSVSPENRYVLPDGYDTPVCAAPAMDNQILRDLFAACRESQRLLGVDPELRDTLGRMMARLPEDKVGSRGQLLEWDGEYPELTPGMGHISHLYACFPGDGISWKDAPRLMEAVRKSLELRIAAGAGVGGWPLAWYINVYARLLDGNAAGRCVRAMLARSSARNLLNAVHVFQIDGNLGAAAGIAECLLQSHVALHFLPALPPEWRDGSVTGLRARGAREIDLRWSGGRLMEAVVRPRFDGPVEVVGETLAVTRGGLPVETRRTDTGFAFAGAGGMSYRLTPLAAAAGGGDASSSDRRRS
jgi:alpha-L-fucosidase 2